MGTRGWIVRPSAKYPEGSTATGNVVLRFSVMPNGDVTNITPIKRADAALVNAAVAGLRRARARALPDEAPQAPQTATITYTFRLD
jgi:TonB family protein